MRPATSCRRTLTHVCDAWHPRPHTQPSPTLCVSRLSPSRPRICKHHAPARDEGVRKATREQREKERERASETEIEREREKNNKSKRASSQKPRVRPSARPAFVRQLRGKLLAHTAMRCTDPRLESHFTPMPSGMGRQCYCHFLWASSPKRQRRRHEYAGVEAQAMEDAGDEPCPIIATGLVDIALGQPNRRAPVHASPARAPPPSSLVHRPRLGRPATVSAPSNSGFPRSSMTDEPPHAPRSTVGIANFVSHLRPAPGSTRSASGFPTRSSASRSSQSGDPPMRDAAQRGWARRRARNRWCRTTRACA